MKKLMDKIAFCIDSIGGIAVLVMTLVVLLQVIMRYVFNTPMTWTEEFARYLFIYITFLGAALLVYERGHLYVEVIFGNLPGRMKTAVRLLIDFIIFGFSIYLIISSASSMLVSQGSRSTAMQIPMQYISLSVMAGAVLMTLFSLYNIFRDLQEWRKKGGEVS